MPKPRTSAGYSPTQAQHVRATCLYVATVDFLIAPDDTGKRGGTVWNLEPDFAAIVAPGLHLAFRDRELVNLSGKTIRGERASREMWACGPGAFVVLKALAFRLRGENKDAYDLVYTAAITGEFLHLRQQAAAHPQSCPDRQPGQFHCPLPSSRLRNRLGGDLSNRSVCRRLAGPSDSAARLRNGKETVASRTASPPAAPIR